MCRSSNLCICIYQIFISRKFKSFEIDEAEIGIGNQKVKLRPNIVDMQIAYKVWVELSTRKIGLPIDYENDVIVEVYSSWYGFFSVARELVKDVPVSSFRWKNTEKIINLSIEVLNNGVRPHLTKWQARYRRWYDRRAGSHFVNNYDLIGSNPQIGIDFEPHRTPFRC